MTPFESFSSYVKFIAGRSLTGKRCKWSAIRERSRSDCLLQIAFQLGARNGCSDCERLQLDESFEYHLCRATCRNWILSRCSEHHSKRSLSSLSPYSYVHG